MDLHLICKGNDAFPDIIEFQSLSDYSGCLRDHLKSITDKTHHVSINKLIEQFAHVAKVHMINEIEDKIENIKKF